MQCRCRFISLYLNRTKTQERVSINPTPRHPLSVYYGGDMYSLNSLLKTDFINVPERLKLSVRHCQLLNYSAELERLGKCSDRRPGRHLRSVVMRSVIMSSVGSLPRLFQALCTRPRKTKKQHTDPSRLFKTKLCHFLKVRKAIIC